MRALIHAFGVPDVAHEFLLPSRLQKPLVVAPAVKRLARVRQVFEVLSARPRIGHSVEVADLAVPTLAVGQLPDAVLHAALRTHFAGHVTSLSGISRPARS